MKKPSVFMIKKDSFITIISLINLTILVCYTIFLIVGCDFFNQETTVDSVINCWTESDSDSLSKDTQDHSYQKREPYPHDMDKKPSK
jgi:hypothetical protein